MNMSEPQLGQLITGTAERDAIHVAVVPLIAGQKIYRGDNFKLSSTDYRVAYSTREGAEDAIGIVDPFLKDYIVKKGEQFWGLLFPNTVTGMRHHWQHPSFDNAKTDMTESEIWLRDFADKWHFNFQEMINAGVNKDYVVAHGVDIHSRYDLDDGEHDLFWHHLANYTGRKFDEDHRETNIWSCSC
jgi:hypothetical protein